MATPGLPYRVILILLALFITPGIAPAQNPRLDPNFLFPEVYRPALVRSVQVQADGKVVVTGDFTRMAGLMNAPVIRLLAGSTQPDATFAQNVAGLQGVFFQSVPLPSGKLLLATNGYVTLGSVTRIALIQLNADGSPDPGFNADPVLGTIFAGSEAAIVVQPDGKLVVAGRNPSTGGVPTGYLLRLNPDGTLDTAFQAALGATPDRQCTSLALQPNGNILVGGSFFTIGGQSRRYLARLLPSGAVDPSFVPPVTSGSILQVAIQPADGKALVLRDNYQLTRLLPAGTVDPAFQTGTNFSAPITTNSVTRQNLFRLQADGNIVVNTPATRYNGTPIGRLVRLQPTGQLDAAFANTTALANDATLMDLAVLPNGQLLAAGEAIRVGAVGNLPTSLVRLQADGSHDNSFFLNPLQPGIVYDVVREPSGELLIGGNFTEINGQAASYLARLQLTGAVDNAYLALARANYPVYTLALQANGRLLVGGRFEQLNGAGRAGIGRLLPSGTLDSSFAPATMRPNDQIPYIRQIAIQPDGQVLVLGTFNLRASATARETLARLDGSTGQPDRSFRPVDTLGVRRLLVQPDGRIVAAGRTLTITPSGPVVAWRMLPSGALDPTFTLTPLSLSSAVYDEATTVTRSSITGELYLGGTFIGLSSPTTTYLARLSANGIPDTSYQPVFPGFVFAINDVQLQPNDQLLVGGSWVEANQSVGTGRFLSTGISDVSYTSISGPAAVVHRLLILPTGMFVAAGSFQMVSGLPVSGLAQLITNTMLSVTTGLPGIKTEAWPIPARTTLYVNMDAKSEPQQVTLLDMLGRVIIRRNVTSAPLELNVSSLPAGSYILRAQYAHSMAVRHIVIE